MSAITQVRDIINDNYAASGIIPDSLEIDPDLVDALRAELQSSAKYLEQGYVVSEGPVNWDDFRFMGVMIIPKPIIPVIEEAVPQEKL